MSDLLMVVETYRPDEMSPSDWRAYVAELRDRLAAVVGYEYADDATAVVLRVQGGGSDE